MGVPDRAYSDLRLNDKDSPFILEMEMLLLEWKKDPKKIYKNCESCGEMFDYKKVDSKRRKFPSHCRKCIFGYKFRLNPAYRHGLTRYSHGHTIKGVKTKSYRLWTTIKDRVFNPKCPQYKYYGGKGITLHSDWLDFKTFYDFLIRHNYLEGDAVIRVNKQGNYEPINCVIVKNGQHAIYEYEGDFLTLGQLHKLATNKISIIGLKKRLKKGMSPKEAITTKINRNVYES